jgi:cephalosporin-C deacetylase-like acetyl esterase
LKFFNEKRLKRDIEQISFLPDYKRAWEIVQNDGYKNIIREYTKRIK